MIKCLYELISVIQDPIVLKYYDDLLSAYYDKLEIGNPRMKKKVIDKTIEGYYYNYGFTEGLYQYWLKYYYPTCLNFTSFLAIYSGEELPYTVFINTTNTALNKLTHFIEEESVEMVRNEMSIVSELMKDSTYMFDYYLEFIWKAKHDSRTCKICKTLDGKVFYYDVDKAHPNCRCTLEVHKKWLIREYDISKEVDIDEEE